jgi:nucleoside-diphosphate-sugar epimerase
MLVSGAGGFIGRHFAMTLGRNGHDVIGLVRKSRPAELENQTGLRLEYADLASVSDNLPPGPFDALIHCAAAIPSAVPNDCELIRINIDGSRRLFEHALRAGVTTIIFCSSMAAYGRIEVDLVDPDTQVRDPNAYGRSKLACEGLLQTLCQSHSVLRALSIRLPGIVGPGSHDNFLSDTMARLVAREQVVARNPDAPFNNVVHVDDLSRFAEELLVSLPQGHRVTTIASDDPIQIREVLAILEQAAGYEDAIRYEQGGRSFLISNESARTLGYRPASVRQSVQHYVASWRAMDRQSIA